jgi:hypothetical protein
MEHVNDSSSRRGLLGRGVALLAGALGAGGATSAGAIASPARAEASTVLSLYGRNFHLRSPGRRAGAVPVEGEPGVAYGELLSGAGEKVGEFRGGFVALGLPFGAGAYAPGSLEQHVFNLENGTIVGLGSATAGEGTFAIVGGTGSYAGARGSYTAIMRPREHGGNSSAEFRLTVLRQEGS